MATGIHLEQGDPADPLRRSAVAVVDAAGRLRRLELAQHDGDLLDALPPSEVVAVDAPLAVPNDDGQRDLERVLAWCDAPPFPASRQRLRRLHGRLRGVDLAPSLAATGDLVEAAPDLVLRQLAWERRRAEDAEPLELGAYREEWLGVRAPAYRPKGRARARPAGLSPAADLLGGVLDLGAGGLGGAPTTPARCTTPPASTRWRAPTWRTCSPRALSGRWCWARRSAAESRSQPTPTSASECESTWSGCARTVRSRSEPPATANS